MKTLPRFETVSSDPGVLQGWTPTFESLKRLSRDCEIQTREEIKPCGCGVKLDLQDVVYPALEAIMGPDAQGSLGQRVDGHVSKGTLLEAKRLVVSAADLGDAQIAEKVRAFGGDSVVELFSTSRDGFKDREITRREYADLMKKKKKLLEQASLRFGKGHSIRAGGDFLLFDVLKHDESAPGYTISNNDTIITADSILRHFAPASVFTSLNNALNDLYLMGVTQGLTVRPVYDGTPDEVDRIRAALESYRIFYADRGVDLQLDDEGPLGRGVKVVGATVIGRAEHELPRMSGLDPENELLVTRFLGDLSFLSMHRGMHFTSPVSDELKRIRIEVLQRFATPGYILAKVVQRFLPKLGEKFDAAKHLSFATDISGPGLFVLEEAAQASGVDVSIEDLRFIDERSLKFYRKNQTSSTNGPLLLGGRPNVIADVQAALQEAGLKETWRLGRVVRKSDSPTMFINPALRDRYASDDPRTDFFAPEVHFGEGDTFQAERVPIFERYRFASF